MDRTPYLDQISMLFKVNPTVAILGPRQCGKTTLAREYAKRVLAEGHEIITFDLEDGFDLARLENPNLALGALKGLIIIDEIQKRPDLFPMLRVLIDNNRTTQHYLILGSASRDADSDAKCNTMTV